MIIDIAQKNKIKKRILHIMVMKWISIRDEFITKKERRPAAMREKQPAQQGEVERMEEAQTICLRFISDLTRLGIVI